MVAGLDFKTTDNTKWGAGSGAGTAGRLTAQQADDNIWTLHQRTQALEDNPPEAVSISGITVIGSQFQVNLTDGSHQGPFEMPVASFRALGQWINDFDYKRLDLVTVPHQGLYMVLIDHHSPVSPAVFDEAAIDEDSGSPTFGLPLYQLVFGEDAAIYDIGWFYPGKPGIGIADGDAIFGHQFVREGLLPADLGGSLAHLIGDPAANMEFKIKLNDTEIGSVNFVAGSNVGTFTFNDDVDIAIGDVLLVMKPTAGVDTDARSLTVTIKMTRTTF